MAIDVTRRRFVGGSAAVAGGLTLGGPMSALAQRSGRGSRARAVGYGPLEPTPEQDGGEIWLDLPSGFKYRIISRQGTMATRPRGSSTAWPRIRQGEATPS